MSARYKALSTLLIAIVKIVTPPFVGILFFTLFFMFSNYIIHSQPLYPELGPNWFHVFTEMLGIGYRFSLASYFFSLIPLAFLKQTQYYTLALVALFGLIYGFLIFYFFITHVAPIIYYLMAGLSSAVGTATYYKLDKTLRLNSI